MEREKKEVWGGWEWGDILIKYSHILCNIN